MFDDLLGRLGLGPINSGARGMRRIERPSGGEITSDNPASGEPLARVMMASADDYERIVAESCESFLKWRQVPAPRRGEVIRQIGLALRERKQDLGLLVTLETGKTRAEGEGEV